MAGRSHAKRISEALDALQRSRTPADRLDAARRAREAAEELEQANVDAARDAGLAWAEIGDLYGMTKQGAQQRFRTRSARTKKGKDKG
jgi:hypothetical protein